MAALRPIRYGSAAAAGPATAISDPTQRTMKAKAIPRISVSPRNPVTLRCRDQTLDGGADAPLLGVGVHLLDQAPVALGHQAALDLARGRDRLALGFRIELGGQHAERLHLLHAGERPVGPLDLAADERAH